METSHKHKVIVYWLSLSLSLSLFLCPKIPQKRLVSASGTLFWLLATTHTNLLQLSCEFRWSHPARPEEAQWKVKEWKRITPDTTALKKTPSPISRGNITHVHFTRPNMLLMHLKSIKLLFVQPVSMLESN